MAAKQRPKKCTCHKLAVVHNANKQKTDSPKLPTKKIAARKEDDDDDEDEDEELEEPEVGVTKYSCKEPYHAHLKMLLANRTFNLKVHKDYKQFNHKSAFNDTWRYSRRVMLLWW
jgi:hypothetical protein